MENNSQPLVTVGIPFYNTEKYLASAINSVINQSYSNWELFLMDDGSSDKSVEIADAFEEKDNRIKVFSDGKNLKLPTRLNQLSKLANGRFYARMDADDMMHPDRLKTQVDYLLKNHNVDLLGTGLVAVDEKNEIIGIRKGSNSINKLYTLKYILKNGWSAHPTIMGKTSWFKNNEYDETLTRTEDIDMWIRTINHSNFAKIQFLGLYYREEAELSLKKYIVSTKQTLGLYWKNRNILGFRNVFLFSVRKILKLITYLIFNCTGLMFLIIKRRSNKLKESDIIYHEKIINNIISTS